MNEEKQSLMANQAPPPTAPPPAYTSGPPHIPPQYTPQQYVNPPQGAPRQGAPQYYPPQGYFPQQQQREVAVVTAVPVQQQEVWLSAGGAILPQPDPGRVVIGGTARYRYGMLMSTSYTYADQLPCLTSTILVFMVLCFFVGSPLSLMCSIPAYYYINKANEEANVQNDIPAARDSYRGYKVSVWGLSFWFGITLVLTITLGILGGTRVI